MAVQVLGKGRAVSAGSEWLQVPLCAPRALGRTLPSSPDKKSKSKLIMSLALGKEITNIGRKALVEGADGADLINTNSLTTRLSMNTLGSAWTEL